ncbi:prepilin peptidase [Microbacterium azadirachtae]|uniref:prepilin peptidase n=1 Tax=Microbacterium azadirachtae TaxID=582680 RepID=UPI0008921C83|nr:A24 family peptidase [Microbacterium azadirachtae]SDM20331.1 leader peptidase (prepilin peptidase) / N-methyltransferase [Microbacterium azadirachtae]SEG42623.1 leader peptidase (prepilin peptidase) / N-methyltransferase [Microbacterium azadirachtae]SEG45743.1 leader peptidase (prepilin peptidase) / N-methyltransferase [Microbacterium azadirachtae]
MTAFLLVFAGLFGLVIGSFLNVVAYRVPAGISLVRESRCPGCDAPIRWWQNVPVVSWVALRGRCAHCAAPISAQYPLIEAFTGVVFVGVAWWALRLAAPVGAVADPVFWVVLVAFLGFAAVSIVLSLIDLETKRLPNAIVLPSIVVGVALLAIAAALGSAGSASGIGWTTFLRAVAGGAILCAFYAVVRLISPRGMGGGDVKLAALVGLFLGWCGWATLIVGAFAAFVLGGLFGAGLILLRRAKRTTAIPFGPWMIAGAWAGIAVGEPIGRWYVGMLGLS